MSVSMTVIQAGQEQKYVHQSASMSVSMTVIQAGQEQKCIPLSPGMSVSMTEPGRAGAEILTSVTR